MIKDIYIKKKLASTWFFLLQQMFFYEFEKLEIDYAKKIGKKPKLFEKKTWKKSKFKKEGGGAYAVIKDGFIFDSLGVNFSEVSGKFDNKFKSQILGTERNSSYWASGISIVAHMKNPNIPAMHFNTRFIVTSKNWFGGGMDVTPSEKDKKEEKLFHKKIKSMCNKHNKRYYKKYKKWCDEYFYLPHRKERRGIGGIFFDNKSNDWEKDFSFVKDVGLCFLDCVKTIIKNKMYKKWNLKKKETQLLKRGRYAEFNLLYDKGTKFGLNTGGNVEAILMSLPPLAKWK